MINLVAKKFGLIVVAHHATSWYIMALNRDESTAAFIGVIALKYMKSLVMVPRAGIEPARPILSWPRILSPIFKCSNYLKSIVNFNFELSSGPHSGLTRKITIVHHGQLSLSVFNQKLTRFFIKIFNMTTSRGHHGSRNHHT